jgi:hypothetical protein
MNRAQAFFAQPGVVAVTGHRLNRLKPAVATQLSHICETTFQHADPACALLSCLADGTDLIAAMAWPKTHRLLSLLPVPVPMWRSILCDLVDPQAFEDVLARTVPDTIASQGTPDYEALADAMVARCDRLFAVWNGEPGLPGGTGSVVARARAAGKPVLHLALEGDRLFFP